VVFSGRFLNVLKRGPRSGEICGMVMIGKPIRSRKRIRVMKHGLLASAIITFLSLSIVSATAAVDQDTLDRLVGYAKQACLVGTQFDFNADVKGNVTFRNPLRPGAEGKAAVNVRNSTGAAAIFDEQLRVIADQNTRECMKPYIDQIFKACSSGWHPRTPDLVTSVGFLAH